MPRGTEILRFAQEDGCSTPSCHGSLALVSGVQAEEGADALQHAIAAIAQDHGVGGNELLEGDALDGNLDKVLAHFGFDAGEDGGRVG